MEDWEEEIDAWTETTRNGDEEQTKNTSKDTIPPLKKNRAFENQPNFCRDRKFRSSKKTKSECSTRNCACPLREKRQKLEVKNNQSTPVVYNKKVVTNNNNSSNNNESLCNCRSKEPKQKPMF